MTGENRWSAGPRPFVVRGPAGRRTPSGLYGATSRVLRQNRVRCKPRPTLCMSANEKIEPRHPAHSSRWDPFSLLAIFYYRDPLARGCQILKR
jgi:hypothetical protein